MPHFEKNSLLFPKKSFIIKPNCEMIRGLPGFRQHFVELEGSCLPKRIFRVLYAAHFISQTAFSMLTPAALFIGLGWFLTRRCGWGKWAMVTSIILGVLTGLYSMIYFLVKYSGSIDPTSHHEEDANGKSAPRK